MQFPRGSGGFMTLVRISRRKVKVAMVLRSFQPRFLLDPEGGIGSGRGMGLEVQAPGGAASGPCGPREPGRDPAGVGRSEGALSLEI